MLSELLGSPRLVASPAARADLDSGRVSPALVLLLVNAVERFSLHVRMIKSGHPMGPVSPAGRPNSHYFYCAADVYAVDGEAVAARPISGAVVGFGEWLMGMAPPVRPSTVMGPAEWHAVLGPGDRQGFRDDGFANCIHEDHLHLGVDLPETALQHVESPS